jgi:hypothetical protein|tara:strand:+ start:995 stop:1693 length:699 start_codon:yes stop_codon:yes gene_type:complete
MLNFDGTPACFGVIAMRRSGHHPIIRWIAGHYQDTTFVNDFGEEGCGTPRELKDGEFGVPGTYHFADEGTGDCHITNYEDFLVEEGLRAATGKIVLVVRDPYNCFASRLNASFNITNAANDRAIELWLNHSSFISDPRVYPILYNRWFIDEKYRKKISQELCGKPYPARHLDRVSPFGMWSSFDGNCFDGQASKMEVLTRWRSCLSDQDFRRILSHPEIIRLARDIFGMQLC